MSFAADPPDTVPREQHPAPGEPAPNIMLTHVPDNLSMALASLWQNGPAVLVFLRHFGCAFCREQVSQLRQEQAEFARLGVTVAFITVNAPTETENFLRERALSDVFRALCDPEKRAYNAYGLARGGTAEIFSPHVFARGFRAALHGHFQGMPKGDPFQMPGVFIVDTSGIVRYAHRHKDAADNPPNADLFKTLISLR